VPPFSLRSARGPGIAADTEQKAGDAAAWQARGPQRTRRKWQARGPQRTRAVDGRGNGPIRIVVVDEGLSAWRSQQRSNLYCIALTRRFHQQMTQTLRQYKKAGLACSRMNSSREPFRGFVVCIVKTSYIMLRATPMCERLQGLIYKEEEVTSSCPTEVT
jgi:hypothetical protein